LGRFDGVRIGTWNVDACWDQRRQRLMVEEACDVWLLTEIPHALALPGFRGQTTRGRMSRSQHWAAVFARDLVPADEPDPATAAAQMGEVTLWSSVLPWPASGPQGPWAGDRHNDRVSTALRALRVRSPEGPLIWGGDWNHSLHGRVIGSREGRSSVIELADALGLQVPTAELPHRIAGAYSIDHIALPGHWHVTNAYRVRAEANGRRLSDHDVYVAEVDIP
jgi:endonuclease/exonuclease/phosphatase family metal-dependent hydrolase